MNPFKKKPTVSVTIEVSTTDGNKTGKTVTVPEGTKVGALLKKHGFPHDKHDLFLDGKPVDSKTVIETAPRTLSVQPKQAAKAEPPAATLQARERPQGS